MRLTAFAALCAGCSYHLYSPPARTPQLDSAATLGAGQTTIRLDGAYSAALFDGAALSGQAELRRGLSDGLDLAASLTYARFADDSNPDLVNLYLGRAGLKRRLVDGPVAVAVVGGVGAAFDPGIGTALAVDLALLLSYEHPSVAPFLSVGSFASFPIGGGRNVFLGTDSDGTGHWDEPDDTLGVTCGGGIKVPLGAEGPALVVGLAYVFMSDSEASSDMISATAGFEIPID